MLNSRRYNHWVFYQIKDSVEDIVKQVFQFLKRDQQLTHDLHTYQTLFTNRELAVNKLQIQEWQRSTRREKVT
jgi:ArsR family transcriptional regulator